MTGKEQGMRGEKMVERACDHLKQTWPHLAYHVAYKQLDTAGVDRLLILTSGVAFVLNAKTSTNGMRDHFSHKGREWYQYITPILISPEEVRNISDPYYIRQVAQRIKAEVLKAYRKIKEQPLPR